MKHVRIGVICCFALVMGLLGGATNAQATGCEANKICVFTSTTYENLFGKIDCSFSGATPKAVNQSATNRCGNKTNWLRTNGTVVVCMNPGGNRPHPGVYNEVYVAKEYGAFC
jgi:hypothetical protein